MRKSIAAAGGLLAGAMLLGTTPAWSLTAEQEAKLLASDPTVYSLMGWSVTLDGHTALLGAYEEELAGAAYVFIRTGDGWSQEARLLPDFGETAARFGRSVALDGDLALVGAYHDSDHGVSSGAAYLFTRTGDEWTREAKLAPWDNETWDLFGAAVALDGETAIVGAYGDDHDHGANAGTAYVYTRTEAGWVEQARLLPADGTADDQFGWSVALDGYTAVIGAPGDDVDGADSGSAYVFTRTGDVWTERAKLVPAEGTTEGRFGTAVAVSANRAMVGAHYYEYPDTHTGSAYLFVRDGSTWSQEAELTPGEGENGCRFGGYVALDGKTAIVGAPHLDHGAHYGSAYVFTREASGWREQVELLPADGTGTIYFGYSVALDGNTVLCGAPNNDDNGVGSGSAYVFRLYDDDVPATSFRGLAVTALLLLAVSTLLLRRRRPAR